jgi:translation initiation factor IF-3
VREKDRGDHRINQAITAQQVRLVGTDGTVLGVVSAREALAKAEAVGLDLVEIAGQATPPVCKIMDYGKFRYEEQKKKNEAKKKQKTIEIKEIKLRPGIEENDYQVKMRAVRRFLAEGNKVKISLWFRGREMAHAQLGLQVMDRVSKDLDADAKIEMAAKMEGKQAIMVVAPKN